MVFASQRQLGDEAVTATDCVPPATPNVALAGLSEKAQLPVTMVVESVAVADADPPPLTVTELTCGDEAPAGTLTVTVIAG